MTTTRSSKFVLVASSFLTAYALLALIVLHAHSHHGGHHHGAAGEEGHHHHGGHHHGHREGAQEASPSLSMSSSPSESFQHHHGKEHHHAGAQGQAFGEKKHHHKTCGPKALAWVALLTGLTGMYAGASPRSRRARCYIAMLFVFELVLFVSIAHASRKQLFKCHMDAVKIPVTINVVEVQLGNVVLATAKETQGTPFVDVQQEAHCAGRVRHALGMTCLFLAVVFGGLFGCATRLLRDVTRDEMDERAAAVQATPAPWTEVATVCVVTSAEPVKEPAGEEAFSETDRMVVVSA